MLRQDDPLRSFVLYIFSFLTEHNIYPGSASRGGKISLKMSRIRMIPCPSDDQLNLEQAANDDSQLRQLHHHTNRDSP